jgi:hypothetical protein
VRCGRSVADPPDDPVVVEAAGEVAERLSELLDGRESLQPEQLLFGVRMNRSTRPLPYGSWRMSQWCATQFPETPIWDSRAQCTTP